MVTTADRVSLFLRGQKHDFAVVDPLQVAAQDHDSGLAVIAPMPGLVTSLRTKAGAKVDRGTPLLVLEAMKMEHTLAAARAGTVAEVLAAPGDQVEAGAALIRLEDETEVAA